MSLFSPIRIRLESSLHYSNLLAFKGIAKLYIGNSFDSSFNYKGYGLLCQGGNPGLKGLNKHLTSTL